MGCRVTNFHGQQSWMGRRMDDGAQLRQIFRQRHCWGQTSIVRGSGRVGAFFWREADLRKNAPARYFSTQKPLIVYIQDKHTEVYAEYLELEAHCICGVSRIIKNRDNLGSF